MREITVRFGAAGEAVRCEEGTAIAALVEHFGVLEGELAAARANNETLPLSARLFVNTVLEPLYLDTHEGQAIYRRTLAFVLAAAAQEVFPSEGVTIGHALGYAFYYAFTRANRVEPERIAALEEAMRELVRRDLPIELDYVSYDEARALFAARPDTALLLDQRNEARIPVNRCGSYTDIFTSTLLSRTGQLAAFTLLPYRDGFLLRFPATGSAGKLGEFRDEPKIFDVYSEYKRWGRIVGLHSAGQLNHIIAERGIQDFIRIAEAFHEKKLFEITNQIYERRDNVKIVLIAGPSSSGKTTTAKRLAIALKVMGLVPIQVSLDNYYLHPDKVPRDEEGKPDLECLEALDVPYLNEQLVALFSGEEVTLPVYDFKTNLRTDGKRIRLLRRNILILEGIHGLNDRLTEEIDAESKFKLYVSALTQLNIDDHNRVSTSDNRLLRRIVRDYNFRGASALRSLGMWRSVRAGEQKHIFPFQNSANAIFNSALDYELSVLKFYAEPLLRMVKPNCREYAEAVRLLAFLENFTPIPPQYVPPLSILREFIGESQFKY